MREFLNAILLIIVIISCCCKNENTTHQNHSFMNNISEEELTEIRKPLDLYVQAAIEGDSNVAFPAFAKNATISHVENDSLICLPIQTLFDYYDSTGKQSASYIISECNIAGNIAMVRIESQFGEAKFTDMFALVKDGDSWKIVSKIFTPQ